MMPAFSFECPYPDFGPTGCVRLHYPLSGGYCVGYLHADGRLSGVDLRIDGQWWPVWPVEIRPAGR